MKKQLVILLLILLGLFGFSQPFSNLRFKQLLMADTLQLDTLSLVPNSLQIYFDEIKIPDEKFTIDYARSHVILRDSLLRNKKLRFQYRVFPVNFSQSYPAKLKIPQFDSTDQQFSKAILPGYRLDAPLSGNDRLQINGSISRGVAVGNAQNMVVNSDMNLQLSGYLSDKIQIDAVLSDNNVPIQPDGYSQQIQEFDKVYVRIYDSLRYLQMGDIELKTANSHFLKVNRKIQGLDVALDGIQLSKKTKAKTKVSGALAKGSFNRYNFMGIEGVQGPYKLVGAKNESYIVVLAGSEKIYLDGELLQRGENADYVINYNTAELSFSTNRMITKDSRIIAEFEYTDRNYNRFLFYTSNEITRKNSNYNFQFFSESDAKNQAVNIDLTDKNKLVLQNAGDDPLKALVPYFDSTAFDKNLVMYKLVDTLVNTVLYDSVFVQSYNPDSAFYKVGFALVGENKGNYIQIDNAANGRVFKWLAPQGGIPQGNYQPVQILAAPQKHQMFVVNAHYKLPGNLKVGVEMALSNKDENTFSSFDASDNKGFALKNSLNKTFQLQQSTIDALLNYELLSAHFNPFEKFRNAEFNRDWNLLTPVLANEHFVQGELKWKKKKNFVALSNELLHYENAYEGNRTLLVSNLNFLQFTLNTRASLLQSNDELKESRFYRHQVSLSRNFFIFNLGVSHQFEDNQMQLLHADSLLANSHKFSVWQSYIKTQDSLKRQAKILYKYRKDYLPLLNQLKLATEAQDFEIASQLTKSRANQLNASLVLRELKLVNEQVNSNLKADQNLLGKVEHRLNLWKRLVSFSTFYEVGTGMETKKEFSYLEVAPGQGTYEWNDYNGNEVPELNEFEVSMNPESANYIKIYTPTKDYIKVYSLKLNEGFRFEPRQLLQNKKGVLKLVSKFSNVFNYQLQQKQTHDAIGVRLNPFNSDFADSLIITKSESLRNTLSFNRTGSVFSMDYIFNKTRQKSLLSNGFDQNQSLKHQLNIRWNISSAFSLLNSVQQSQRIYNSEFFPDKNYKIQANENHLNLHWQPSTKFRTSLFYKLKIKENVMGAEQVFYQEAGPELKINSPKKGLITLKASIILNDYSGETNSSVAYLLLEGFQPGENYRWSAHVSRNLNKFLQLSLSYNGRKPAGVKVIHTGNVSLSAYF